MKNVILPVLFAAAAFAMGCSSSSSAVTPVTSTDAGAKDSGTSTAHDASASVDSSTPVVEDAGASLGTGGSTTSDGGTCGFTTAGPAEAYTGADSNGDPIWLFYGTGTDTRIAIENYAGMGGISAAGTVQFTSNDESYETCGFCIILQTGCDANGCAKTFMPVAGQGSVNVTELGAIAGHFTGDLSGVQLREVTIDATSFATAPVVGGTTQCLSGVHFEGLLDDVNNMP